MNSVVSRLAAATFWAGIAFAQPAIHFKTRTIRPAGAPVSIVRPFHGSRPEHLVLQFESPPEERTIAELRRLGASVLQHVPENGLLVFVDRPVRVAGLGVRSMFPIDPADKISPLVNGAGRVLVEFHPDVDRNAARGIVLQTGATLEENPDLNPQHLLVDASAAQIAELARRDETAYIFPASPALLRGNPTQPCLGAVTSLGATAQSIPTYGSWNPGGAATIGYVFSQLAGELSASLQESEVERAMAQWAAVVQVTWQQGTNATAPRAVNILFTTGDHGDGYPFGPAGGVLAHTFYPSPPNPEPIAGDMHFNNANTFRVGANVDVFSVALHELGHALGLGHADDPTAAMYPYYSMHSGLSPLDIAAVQTLYAARTAPPPTPTPAPAAPLTLSVSTPLATTTAGAVNLTGTTSGGKAAATVTWSSSLGSGAAQGSAAWTIPGIPLAIGANSIVVSATDGVSRVAQTVSITRQASPSPAPPSAPGGTAPPSLTINTPSATSISTAASSIVFAGIAGAGVTSVTWSTNTGHSGIANGTTQWSATIPLLAGSNAVIVQAHNAAGQIAWRSVVVTRQ